MQARLAAAEAEVTELRRLFATLRPLAERFEYVHTDPDDIAHVLCKHVPAMHSDDDLADAVAVAREDQQDKDDARLDREVTLREEVERERDEARAMVYSLRRQLDHAEQQLTRLADDADEAAKLALSQLVAQLDELQRQNAELVDDLKTVATRAQTALDAPPPARNRHKPLQAALELINTYAAQAAETGARMGDDRQFGRTAALLADFAFAEVPRLRVRLLVNALDSSDSAVVFEPSEQAWDGFKNDVGLALESLAQAVAEEAAEEPRPKPSEET